MIDDCWMACNVCAIVVCIATTQHIVWTGGTEEWKKNIAKLANKSKSTNTAIADTFTNSFSIYSLITARVEQNGHGTATAGVLEWQTREQAAEIRAIMLTAIWLVWWDVRVLARVTQNIHRKFEPTNNGRSRPTMSSELNWRRMFIWKCRRHFVAQIQHSVSHASLWAYDTSLAVFFRIPIRWMRARCVHV